MAKSYKQVAVDYATAVLYGKKRKVGKEVMMACVRFMADLNREDLELHTLEPDFVIGIIETTMVHMQGEDLEGNPLMNTPLLLQDWQVFIVYNLIGFYYRGTNERRYKEAFIFIPRKNGKTTFIAALVWGLALLERRSGATIYIVAASQKQACQSFNFILHSLRAGGMIEDFTVHDSLNEHSIKYTFEDENGLPCGSIRIEALASNPDAQDSFNCNIAIADEIHAFKKASQYNRFKEAMKAYTNKLMIGGLLAAAALLVLLISHNLKGGTDTLMTIVWTAAIILFGIVEAVTAGLVCIWFVAGALVALVAAFVDAPLPIQIVLFLVVSAAALALTRPLLGKITNATATPTNADRVLGEFAKVTETIDNENSSGAVYVDGKTWSARSADGTVIPAGERVSIESMEGVKLLVKSVEKKTEVV